MPILATPYQPPALPRAQWPGIASMTWTGADGSVWDLTGKSGGISLQAGTRGMNAPEWAFFTSESPALAGSIHRGYRTLAREVFWPVRVYSDGGSAEWVEYDRAFWKTLGPGKVGVWEVVQPSGEARRLACRLTSDGGHAHDVDPSLIGWARYGLYLTADAPYWLGDPIERSWTDAGLVPFYGNTGTGGPPFNISSGNTIGSAKMSNPGDVDAYPVWTITAQGGSISSVSVGVGSSHVVYGDVIPDGQTRTIDCHPDKLTVIDQDGADRSDSLGMAEFAGTAIPAESTVGLSLAMTGTGSVAAAIEPAYFRAMG